MKDETTIAPAGILVALLFWPGPPAMVRAATDELILCRQIADGQPVGAADRFSPKDEFNAWVRYSGVPANTTARCVWMKGEQEIYRQDRQIGGDSTVWFNVKTTAPGGWPAGTYRVIVTAGDRTLGDKSFTVDPAAEPPQTGTGRPPAEGTPGWTAESGGTVSALGLTATNLSAEQAQAQGLPGQGGARVESVEPNGPAAKAGVKPGDVVVQLGPARVSGLASLREASARVRVGQPTDLVFVRQGQTYLETITPRESGATPETPPREQTGTATRPSSEDQSPTTPPAQESSADRPSSSGPQEQCAAQMKTIYAALKQYAQEHPGKVPATLSELYFGGFLEGYDLFACPASGKKITLRTDIDRLADYQLASREFPTEGREALLREAGARHGGKAHVLYSDGTTALEGSGREPEPTTPSTTRPSSDRETPPPTTGSSEGTPSVTEGATGTTTPPSSDGTPSVTGESAGTSRPTEPETGTIGSPWPLTWRQVKGFAQGADGAFHADGSIRSCMQFAGDEQWTDYAVEADFLRAQHGGLMVRVTDTDYVFLLLRPQAGEAYWLERGDFPEQRPEQQMALDVPAGQDLRVRLEARGGTFRAWVNQKELPRPFRSGEHPQGGIGLFLFGPAGAEQGWKNIRVGPVAEVAKTSGGPSSPPPSTVPNPAPPQLDTSTVIKEAVLCTGVEGTSPVGATQRFPRTASKVALFFRYQDAPAGTELDLRWGQGKEVRSRQLVIIDDETGQAVSYIYTGSGQPFEPGLHWVELSLNGQRLGRIEYVIE